VIRRLRVSRDVETDLHSVLALRDAGEKVRDAVKASQVYRLLHPHSARALRVAWLAAGDDRIRAHIDWFNRELIYVKPSVGGALLKSLGIRPGPQYGRILHAVRDALLDGEVKPGEEEEAFVRELLDKSLSENPPN